MRGGTKRDSRAVSPPSERGKGPALRKSRRGGDAAVADDLLELPLLGIADNLDLVLLAMSALDAVDVVDKARLWPTPAYAPVEEYYHAEPASALAVVVYLHPTRAYRLGPKLKTVLTKTPPNLDALVRS